MDFFNINQETLSYLLVNYGSWAIFILLALGIVALPVPDESLIVLSGFLIHKEHLHPFPTLIAAYGGSLCGITISYLIGRSGGHFILQKYGGWIGLTAEKQNYIHNWFERYGKWTLVVGYFIPGMRHFTGLSAGMVELEFHHFALFAYSGAFLWVSTFLIIGYFLSDYYIYFFENLELSSETIIISAVLLVLAFCAFKILWSQRKSSKGK